MENNDYKLSLITSEKSLLELHEYLLKRSKENSDEYYLGVLGKLNLLFNMRENNMIDVKRSYDKNNHTFSSYYTCQLTNDLIIKSEYSSVENTINFEFVEDGYITNLEYNLNNDKDKITSISMERKFEEVNVEFGATNEHGNLKEVYKLGKGKAKMMHSFRP